MSEETRIIKKAATDGAIRGPLGIWPWPITNLLLALIDRLKTRSGTGAVRGARTKITEVRPTAEGGWSILEHEV